MLQVSGGIDWTEGSGNRMRYLFEDLALTLGRPDFAESTDEDLEPTLLFQKFLGDAARNICLKMIDADLAAHRAIEAGEPTEWTPRLLVHVGPNDTLSSNPDGVRANMQTLLQSFHGRRSQRTRRVSFIGIGFLVGVFGQSSQQLHGLQAA